MSSQKFLPALTLPAIALLVLTGCSSADTSATSTASASTGATASASASEGSAPLTVDEAWIKANSGDMTAAFATLTNTGDTPITIEGASNTSASMVELHTTVIDPTSGTSTMKAVEGGFTIEPGATLELAPGGDHIMLMGMSCALAAGTSSSITLQTSAGEVNFEATVRDYAGAQEEYAPGEHTSPPADVAASESTDHSMHSAHASTSESAAVVLPQCN
ncbi:copper chaperone PCu(A)C [Rothia nasimurium]|uniref:copper chaperone PCu(A)C n=1 Tax=Rothia nasimurium TaxID=85336 RepID=UPI001F257124|nr:copper chaperone PCu(A)C [Rothia nasimurium]